MIDSELTKRQHEILERLEEAMPVKKIAKDLGVSRNAVYLQIERLRAKGVLPPDYTPSGQPPRTRPRAAPAEAGPPRSGAAGTAGGGLDASPPGGTSRTGCAPTRVSGSR